MEELKRKAELLLEQCESVVLTSIDENGFPRPVPDVKGESGGDNCNLVCYRNVFRENGTLSGES